MKIAFVLSMPNVGSWNGKWTGSGNLYARVLSVGNSKSSKAKFKDIIAESPYHHNFGDGWTARVDVKEVTDIEARDIKKRSRGFYGYDWMIENIRFDGKIS